MQSRYVYSSSIVTFIPQLSLTYFPPQSDYCIVAFAIIVLVSVFQWVVDGHKNFTGPRVNLVSGQVVSEADAAASGVPGEDGIERTKEGLSVGLI